VCFAGGFDGWDIYREFRTNQDRFQLGSSGYLSGAYPSSRYPTATGDGIFKRIVVQNNTQDFANTDYYAYLLGILTFANPEATNINVFATSSIDYVNNSNLVEEAIDMVQYSRADSVYIATTPDYNMYTPDSTNPQDIIYSQEAVDNLDNTGIDSNYTATYYPWILTRDTVNNTQIYLPPTGEVCRNLALTDNISFPWFASAGYTRGLVNSIKARQKLTQTDRDTLYQGRINPIATFSDVGTVIWGNKTLQVADTALNRLNVRRLLLQARKLISAVAVRLLFEQNDQVVRQQFLDSVNPILDSIRRDRGLYDFRVTVSSSPEDLDRNTLTGKIYLKPTKALEFIDIEFFITPTGASFENI
jgi:phage tail sheath protein FI